ncbi:hypothetical protein [Niallia circulans]|uniref:Glycoside hydrolase family 42 N-terminal domain-containing protein n=1 Tax=Niallia circulans TaxID=1397 RepID=A0A941GFG4_NIACI|nr:hypothetical protein [Niallia circulans]MCB5239536.1 hypothetical protein [Niallia circulans]
MVEEKNNRKIEAQNIRELVLLEQGSSFLLMNVNNQVLSQNEIVAFPYLVMRLENPTKETLTLQLDFYEEGQSYADAAKLTIAFDILPCTDVTVPINLDYLNSQTLFPPRTPGRLRMMVSGKPLDKDKVKAVFLRSRPFYQERMIKLKNIYLSDEADAVIHQPETLIDELGQWKYKEWPEKISNRVTLNALLRKKRKEAEDKKETDRSRFGGALEKKGIKTGWFYVEKQNGKWWLVDPEGFRFISCGIDCINPGTDTRIDAMEPYMIETLKRIGIDTNEKKVDFQVNNLKCAFGEEDWWLAWATIVKNYFQKWGINTIGNWSSLEFIKWADLPYVIPLDSLVKGGFPQTEQTIFRDFPDVFAKEYEVKSAIYAQGLEPFKDDPNMIGYFMRNEPEWGFVYNLNIAEEMLATSLLSASKQVFIKTMEEKYQKIELFNQAWNLSLHHFTDLSKVIKNATQLSETAYEDLCEFSRIMITKYVEIPAKACREVDAKHMNLGMRYSYVASELMLSGSEYFDVFSINCYQETPIDKIEEIAKIIDKPVMIGEFHFGAIDKGLTATGIKGVLNQKERGIAYQYYMETASTHSHFVGAHFFQLSDQSCLGRFDGENYQIGFLDCCLQEYHEMTDYVRITNERLPAIHEGKQVPIMKRAKGIPPIFC